MGEPRPRDDYGRAAELERLGLPKNASDDALRRASMEEHFAKEAADSRLSAAASVGLPEDVDDETLGKALNEADRK